MQITAQLRNAFILDNRIHGAIENDSLGRFRDGEQIITSTIVTLETPTVFKTRNNVYEVVSWRDGRPVAPAAPANDNRSPSLTVDQSVLLRLAEECCEVGQRVSKALLFGLDEVQEGQSLNNTERLVNELHDIIAVAIILERRGVLRTVLPNLAQIEAKRAKIVKFLALQKERGTLIGEVAL